MYLLKNKIDEYYMLNQPYALCPVPIAGFKNN